MLTSGPSHLFFSASPTLLAPCSYTLSDEEGANGLVTGRQRRYKECHGQTKLRHILDEILSKAGAGRLEVG